jgi:hypothetical protein
MTIGNRINDLIMTHIELWHRTSKARVEKDLPTEERLALFMKTRELNVLRAKIRDEINKEFSSGYQDPKINYKE